MTLVTGATGFVGSAVARQLVDHGHAVRALVRPTSDRRNLEGLPVEICVGDLLDPGHEVNDLVHAKGMGTEIKGIRVMRPMLLLLSVN